MKFFHSTTVAPPSTIPASAPARVVRLTNSAANITGPNAAPNPAQAYDTSPNTDEFGSRAIQ